MKFKKYIKESTSASKLILEITSEYNRDTLIESLHDLDKRCENCNTLLNDQGTCPKCDDGEEDYEDTKEVNEALTNKEKLMRAFPGEFNFDLTTPVTEDIESNTEVVEEELSNREKLKRAYPELNFDRVTEDIDSEEDEEIIEEELSNKEKLKRAYPELNFDNTITEGVGADILNIIKKSLPDFVKSQDGKSTLINNIAKIVDVVPDNFADELFDIAEKKLSNINLSTKSEEEIANSAGIPSEEHPGNLNKIFDFLDKRDFVKENPELTKQFIVTTLKAVAAVEPTPVVDVIAAIVSVLPANVVASITTIIQSFDPTTIAGSVLKKMHKSTSNAEEPVTEDIDEDEFNYDDDYYDLDDVEEDRRHTSLYGGDREYCSCGKKLIRTEWGGYCPDCDNEEEFK